VPHITEWEPEGILWTYSGHVTADEIMAANMEFYDDLRSELARYQLVDAREVTSLEWDPTEIAKTAAFDKGAEATTVKDVRVAYVTLDPAIRGKIERYADISRQLETSWEFRGFEDLDAARAWATSR